MNNKLTPINLDHVHGHFVETYQLTLSQAERMVTSGSKSVTEALVKCQEAFEAGERQDLSDSAHNLKGVLLNMGENGWAELARELELDALNEEDMGGDLLKEIKDGCKELVLFHTSEGE